MSPLQYDISCNCRATHQVVSSLSYSVTEDTANISLCHCADCRHVTGILCTSYIRIAEPPLLESTTSYATSETATRYFCSTCGCHCFVRRHLDGEWSVATGIIRGESPQPEERSIIQINLKHEHVESTVDGGLAAWMSGAKELHDTSATTSNPPSSSHIPFLSAHCHCRNVSFKVTRPNASSPLPQSNFPDLMIPYHSNSPQITNPNNEKWWLRDGDRYLAGTCACKSCRLCSGSTLR